MNSPCLAHHCGSPRIDEGGLTLIEVLVAVVVLAIGLLGVAALQSSAIQNNLMSSQYTTAAGISQGLSEKMRANRGGVIAGFYDISGVPANPPVNCAAAECTSEQLADWDLASTYLDLVNATGYSNVPGGMRGTLPSGALDVRCMDATCNERSPRLITIYWDAERSGVTGTECSATSTTDLKCFRLVHIP